MSKRKHCRAPLLTSVLAEVNKGVKRVRGVNISQSGVLLDHLPEDMPESFKVLFSLAKFPDFSKVDKVVMSKMNRHSIDHNIVRATVRLSRKCEIRQGYYNGYEFIHFDKDFQRNVFNYTNQMASNLSYYLNLFEIYDRSEESEKNNDYIRTLARLLGYIDGDKVVSLRTLRSKGLHDFQNLDQL